jgi:hypothetical protein
MPNLAVPYRLFGGALMFLISSFAFRYWMMRRFQAKYGDSRRHFSLFLTKCRIAQGSGNPERLRQIRMSYPEYWTNLVSTLCLIVSGLLFTLAIIWYDQIRFGRGLLTGVVSLGLIELALIIGYIITRRQADKAFVSSSKEIKARARKMFERELTVAMEEGDLLKIRRVKAEQPLFVYYDNLGVNTSMAAFLILIPFLIGLVRVIWY